MVLFQVVREGRETVTGRREGEKREEKISLTHHTKKKGEKGARSSKFVCWDFFTLYIN